MADSPTFFARGHTPTLSDTQWFIEQRILGALVDGAGAASGEILAYTTTGPTADGVLPSDLNHQAIAVKPGGSTFTWDSTLHVWDDV